MSYRFRYQAQVSGVYWGVAMAAVAFGHGPISLTHMGPIKRQPGNKPNFQRKQMEDIDHN